MNEEDVAALEELAEIDPVRVAARPPCPQSGAELPPRRPCRTRARCLRLRRRACPSPRRRESSQGQVQRDERCHWPARVQQSSPQVSRTTAKYTAQVNSPVEVSTRSVPLAPRSQSAAASRSTTCCAMPVVAGGTLLVSGAAPAGIAERVRSRIATTTLNPASRSTISSASEGRSSKPSPSYRHQHRPVATVEYNDS